MASGEGGRQKPRSRDQQDDPYQSRGILRTNPVEQAAEAAGEERGPREPTARPAPIHAAAPRKTSIREIEGDCLPARDLPGGGASQRRGWPDRLPPSRAGIRRWPGKDPLRKGRAPAATRTTVHRRCRQRLSRRAEPKMAAIGRRSRRAPAERRPGWREAARGCRR